MKKKWMVIRQREHAMRQLRKILGNRRLDYLQRLARKDGYSYEHLLREVIESYLSQRNGAEQDERWKNAMPAEYRTPEARRLLGLEITE